MAELRILEGESSEIEGPALKEPRHQSMRHRSAHALARLLSHSALAVALLLLWQLTTTLFQINPYILPSPIVILNTLVNSLGFLSGHMLVTLEETLLGFILAGVVGVGLAMILGHFRWLRESSYPILMFVQTTPKVALAPVLLVWFGYGLLPKLAMTFLSAFFPVLINSMAGFTAIDEELLYLTRVLGARPAQVYRKVRLANALPYMFAGFKVGITLAVLGSVVAEFVSSDRGLGFIIVTAQGQLRTDLAFAAIFLLALIGLGLFFTLELLQRLLMPWQPKEV